MRNFKNQRGDTIVEVLLSIAILALALAISYSLANRSLRAGLSANARTEATAIAQGQIELLKAARYNNPSTFNSMFRQAGAFCVNPTSMTRQTAPCANADYQTSITYDNARNIHTITTEWDSFNVRATSKDRLIIQYRVPQ